MNKLKHKTRRWKRFLREDIWALEMEELSKARARFIRYVKVLIITVKTFSQQKVAPRATALSYLSMMSVVPFIALVFAITGGLGLSGRLKGFMYANFGGSESIDMVLKSAQNIIDGAQGGGMGLISALIFIWIIFRLMMNIESAFNIVWKVDESRKLVRRFAFYIAILLIAPFVIFVMFTGAFIYSNALDYIGLSLGEFSIVKKIISWALFIAITTFTFSAMYKFIPNYKVNYSTALRAAFFAAIAFVAVQFFYLETQVFVSRLNSVYGTFAAVPLFMIWLNISWSIILIGAQVSYAFQHVDSYNIED